MNKKWEINDNALFFPSLWIRKGYISELTPTDKEEFEKFEKSLDKGVIPEKLKERFKAKNIQISENVVKESEWKWVTTDEKKEHTYCIKKEEGTLKICGEPSFKELISGISDYAYDKRKLDAGFEIKTWLEDLLERELFLSITKKRHRDHLLHACRIALLGERLLLGKITYDGKKEFRLLDLVRELFKKQKNTQELLELYEVDTGDNDTLDELILQTWFIAALFHDVGFIYEALTEVWENSQVLMKFPNFKEMYLDVEKALTNFKKRFSVSDVHEELYKNKFTREFGHSKIGACLISNLLRESNLICDMAAFIADQHSSNETLSFTERPLSFLLILLDELQEWERPVLGRKLRDQILSEKISNLSPFIEYPKVKPELRSISVSSDSDRDFEIKMENGNLNLDFTLDYGDNPSVLEKTDFSFPLMLYLKYKDLQRLRIGDEGKLKDALREALEISPLFSIDSDVDIIKALNNENTLELKKLFEKEGKALEKPQVLIIQKNREWEVVDGDKKYLVHKENDKLYVKSDLAFNLSVSFDFICKGALAIKWHRQCDILLFETLENKNNVLSNWLDNIINYRIKDTIKFEIGNMPRVLCGNFKEVIARSHEIYLRDEKLSEEELNVVYTYEKFEKDKIKLLIKINAKLKNNNPEKIERIFPSFDAEIMNLDVKEVLENGNLIDRAKIFESPIPKKKYEKGEYDERFVMSIPFTKPLLQGETRHISYKVEITLPISCILENGDLLVGFYNVRQYNTRMGKIRVNWDKKMFEDKPYSGLFLNNCTYEEMEFIQSKENKNKIITSLNDTIKLEDAIGEIERKLKEKHEECECIIFLDQEKMDDSKNYFYFEREFKDIEPRHLAGFIWIPKK
jgi:hypothetical protein